MIAECLDRNKPFGMVRAKEEGIAEIGCTAEIITVTKKYPDGRMDILLQGRERFEVMQVNQERLPAGRSVSTCRMNRPALPEEKSPGNEAPRRDPGAGRSAVPNVRATIENSSFRFTWRDRFRSIWTSNKLLLEMKSEDERLRAVICLFRSHSCRICAGRRAYARRPAETATSH